MMDDLRGIKKTLPEIDDNKGISLILINIVEEAKAFNEIKSELDIWESNTLDCLQLNLIKSTE